jgi:hypothetical protein
MEGGVRFWREVRSDSCEWGRLESRGFLEIEYGGLASRARLYLLKFWALDSSSTSSLQRAIQYKY